MMARTSLPLAALLLLYGFAFGLGTNFTGAWYYPIRGIGWIDLLVVLHFGWLLLAQQRKYPVHVLQPEAATLAFLMLLLATWLLLATLVNTSRFILEAREMLAILRLVYFVLIILFVSRYVEQHGFSHLVIGFLIGAAVVFYQDFSTLTEEGPIKAGIPILANPNVVGAQLGLSVYFCSLGIIAGKEKVWLALAVVFAAMSVTTFSKGAWLLVTFGLMANLLALRLKRRGSGVPRKPFWPYVAVLLAVGGFVLHRYGDNLRTLLEFKLASTEDIGSFDTRSALLRAGLYAGLENPVFGLGYGNYYKVETRYPELPLPELGPEDNAHNLFGQITATGGIPAISILLGILSCAFHLLYKVLRHRVAGNPLVKLAYLGLTVAVFILFASVQLQLLAQPAFWFFCAVLIGWLHSPHRYRAPKESFNASAQPASLPEV